MTSLKSTLYKQTSHIFTNILRDPSLRLGGLDPRALKTGFDVSLSLGMLICQITRLQHNGDHGGTFFSKSPHTRHSVFIQVNYSFLQTLPT